MYAHTWHPICLNLQAWLPLIAPWFFNCSNDRRSVPCLLNPLLIQSLMIDFMFTKHSSELLLAALQLNTARHCVSVVTVSTETCNIWPFYATAALEILEMSLWFQLDAFPVEVRFILIITLFRHFISFYMHFCYPSKISMSAVGTHTVAHQSIDCMEISERPCQDCFF
jgi:hypothetical protein